LREIELKITHYLKQQIFELKRGLRSCAIHGLTHIFAIEDILFFYEVRCGKNISQTRSKGGYFYG
ncbi:MAG: hypothetical protein RBS43_07745, partial [Candidatus Cloacimonas sp.]|nr:hypothetical protein [Candidatus Cloacimonas sp.]